MADNVFEINNPMKRSYPDVFYLDSKTADVNFVFGAGTEDVETVPAHKYILSISSPAFYTMFFGSLPQQGDIPMVDSSSAAFKEFLQFIYLHNIRLTRENIISVTNLCKKYETIEALSLCEVPLQKSLTIDEMCSGYAFAILLELTNTIKFCELKIKSKAEEILKSTSFLECKREVLDKIIQLMASKEPMSIFHALAIVNGCLAWAKAECGRNNLEETVTNLRAQLGKSLNRLPFGGLNMEQFNQFIAKYNGLLDESVQAEIISIFTERERRRALERGRTFRCNFVDYDYYDEVDEVDNFDEVDEVDDFDDFDEVDYFD